MKFDASTVTVEIAVVPADQFDAGYLGVTIYAKPVLGLDRAHVFGWSVGKDTPAHRKLAERLKAAILAGRALQGEALPKTDVNGKTYLSGGSPAVLGRRLNADLRRLGF